jgi:hypothetical protein
MMSLQVTNLINQIELHALAPWFEISGGVLYSFIDRKYLDGFEKAKFPGSKCWKGGKWWTMERWNFWKERLRWISHMHVMTEDQRGRDVMNSIREKARELEGMMQLIEEQPSA